MSYQGWKNYETWCIHLWITNEEGSYRHWVLRARRSRTVYALADELKDAFEEATPALEGFWLDLMGAALSSVDWVEVAKALREETYEDELKESEES